MDIPPHEEQIFLDRDIQTSGCGLCQTLDRLGELEGIASTAVTFSASKRVAPPAQDAEPCQRIFDTEGYVLNAPSNADDGLFESFAGDL